MASVSSTPGWQQTIYDRLLERDRKEKSSAQLVQDYTRLSTCLIQLDQQNKLLLKITAAGASSAEPPSSSGSGSTSADVKASRSSNDHALLAISQSELSNARSLLSEQYRIQSTNAQRLLSLTDALREVEERSRLEREELSGLRKEVEGLRERSRWFREMIDEKERQVVLLQDEHASLTLELNQLALQNDDLKTDNSSLLQRWIQLKNDEASRMNEVNTWMNESRSRSATTEEKGKEKAKEEERIV